ncbi:hypothetical protein PTKIN_Ptkin18bG0137100 [Pterospermum kingtungense]
MGSSRFLVFLYSVLLSLATLTLSQNASQDLYYEHSCNQTSGTYTSNSIYQTNLNRIVSQFSSLKNFNYGFFDLSYGETPDEVHSIALCRGDINQTHCYNCLNYTATELQRFCPFNKAATAWSEYCLVRYANRNMYGLLENDPRTCVYNVENASNADQFNQALSALLKNLSSKAAAGGSLRKYAAGSRTAGVLQTVYAMVQCTPDMDEPNCATCLDFAMSELKKCCEGRIGCRVLRPTCVLRFESNRFFNETEAVPLPSGNGNNTTRTVIIVIASVVGVLILIMIIAICIFKRPKKIPRIFETADEILEAESLYFDFDSIRAATGDFSDANKLGQGGFGAVYKGQLPNGQEIAVKRLIPRGSGQGDIEFKNEVLFLAKLQHRNLVRLLGFSLEGQEKLLIYEFVPNASLDHFIFDPIKRAQLNWETRYKIIGGVARGLLYLHQDSRLRIIHRDLKAGNILLDEDMIPKVADFGTARWFGEDETQGNTNIVTGTYGYMAPEYVVHGQFSVKSDVFSFGVLLLEIISGQKNTKFRHRDNTEVGYILNFAWKSWKEGTAVNLIDPTLGNGSTNEIVKCIHIALLCVQENVAARPTMASVVFMLNSFSATYPVPLQSAFAMDSNIGSDMSPLLAINSRMPDSNKPNTESNIEVTISELSPRS